MKHTLLMLCALVVLLGCGPVAADQPTAQPTQPALAPIVPAPAEPTSANTPEPAPTVATTGEGLTGRLLFVQNGNLWLWQGESGQQISSSGDMYQPAWSPDGTRIVFQSGSGGTFQLYVMNATGAGQPRQVPGLPPYAGQPAWSPDGTHFAFSGGVSATNGREIYTVPITGGTPLQLTANGRTGAGPRWSPDGQALVFMVRQAQTESRDITWIEASGQGQRALSDDPGDDIWPVWSPDGRWVAYFGSRGRANGNEVLVVPAGGGQSINVSNSPAGDVYPSWAPDSTYLVFSSTRSGKPRLYTAARDGSDARALTPADGDYDENFPVWSPR